MNETPRLLRKRTSLSLNKIQKIKRQSVSPKNIEHQESPNATKTPRRLSSVSISSDGGYDFTPPHNNINLNESLESSPGLFDTSFSSNCFLSQTVNSPEVGWRWEKFSNVSDNKSKDNTTPDSAYAADSSLSSSSSSSCLLTREAVKRLRILDACRREEQRRLDELRIRKEEKIRATEALRKRCALLQEQFEDDNRIAAQAIDKKKPNDLCESKSFTFENEVTGETTQTDIKPKRDNKIYLDEKPSSSRKRKCSQESATQIDDSISDFFNDDDNDFLLEATESLESKIIELSQKSSISVATVKENDNKSSDEKRSSLYLQFLEEETPDDWFESMDEIIAQATQTKKPRSSFHRYHSMPEKSSTSNTNSKSPNNVTAITNNTISNSVQENTDTRVGTKFKKHSSTHAFSPTSSKYCERRQRQPRRK